MANPVGTKQPITLPSNATQVMLTGVSNADYSQKIFISGGDLYGNATFSSASRTGSTTNELMTLSTNLESNYYVVDSNTLLITGLPGEFTFNAYFSYNDGSTPSVKQTTASTPVGNANAVTVEVFSSDDNGGGQPDSDYNDSQLIVTFLP